MKWTFGIFFLNFRRVDDDEGRTYELGQCAVKCMRAILCGWMQQAHKVQVFCLDHCC